MTRRARWAVGATLALAYVAGLTGLVFHLAGSQPSGTLVDGRPPSTLPRPASPSAAPAAELTVPSGARVLVVGDGYTEGWGAQPMSRGFAHQLGDLLDWRVTVAGAGSTGYLNPGPRHQGTFRERLARVDEKSFDLVVLQGGASDESSAVRDLAAAVDETVDAVHDRYPGAEVLLMGPVSAYGTATESRGRVNAVLLRSAREHGLPYVNPLYERWFVPGDQATYVTDGRLNTKGHARIAERFAADVRRLSEPAGA